MILVVSPLTIMYLTSSTDVFLWAGVLQNVIGLLGFIFMYIPESTMYLLEKERFAEAKKDIEYLLKYNKANEAAVTEVWSLFARLEEKKKTQHEKEMKKLMLEAEKN